MGRLVWTAFCISLGDGRNWCSQGGKKLFSGLSLVEAAGGSKIVLNSAVVVAPEVLKALGEAHPLFDASWRNERTDIKDPSCSGFDNSIAKVGVMLGGIGSAAEAPSDTAGASDGEAPEPGVPEANQPEEARCPDQDPESSSVARLYYLTFSNCVQFWSLNTEPGLKLGDVLKT